MSWNWDDNQLFAFLVLNLSFNERVESIKDQVLRAENVWGSWFVVSFHRNEIFVHRPRIRSDSFLYFRLELSGSRSRTRSWRKFQTSHLWTSLSHVCSLSRLNKQIIPSDLAPEVSFSAFSSRRRRFSHAQRPIFLRANMQARRETRWNASDNGGCCNCRAMITSRADRVNVLVTRERTEREKERGSLI